VWFNPWHVTEAPGEMPSRVRERYAKITLEEDVFDVLRGFLAVRASR